jgi:hypothetical protein
MSLPGSYNELVKRVLSIDRSMPKEEAQGDARLK